MMTRSKNSKAPDSGDSGESSEMRMVTVSTLPVFCGLVRIPFREFSPKVRSVRVLATFIHVPPT